MTLGRAMHEQCQSDSLSISRCLGALPRTHYFSTGSRPACPQRTGNSGFRVLSRFGEKATSDGIWDREMECINILSF